MLTAEDLAAGYTSIVAESAFSTTSARAGLVDLTVRHNDPHLGEDVVRALWPAAPSPDGPAMDVLCLNADDARLERLLPPASPGVPRVFVPEAVTGQRWMFDWAKGLHTAVDFRRRTALVIWQPSAYGLLVCAPFRILLQWVASDADALLLHGATVGRPEAGVLLIGAGHAGKSTTVMAAVAAGGVTAGDDYVWVEPGRPPVAHSCYRTVKTRHSSVVDTSLGAAGLPGFDMHYDEPKRVHYLGEADAAMVAEQRIVGAVAITLGGAATSWRRISTIEAVLRAAPSSIFQASSDRPRQMAQITALMGGLTCYDLTVSDDLDEVGAGVLRLVDTLIAGGRP